VTPADWAVWWQGFAVRASAVAVARHRSIVADVRHIMAHSACPRCGAGVRSYAGRSAEATCAGPGRHVWRAGVRDSTGGALNIEAIAALEREAEAIKAERAQAEAARAEEKERRRRRHYEKWRARLPAADKPPEGVAPLGPLARMHPGYWT